MGCAIVTDANVIEFAHVRAVAQAAAKRNRYLHVSPEALAAARRAGIRMLLAGESATAAAFRAERVVVEAWNARTGGIPGSAS